MLYIYVYLYLYKFLKKFLKKDTCCVMTLISFNKKKNLFFKKKYRSKILTSKRLLIALRKRKKLCISRSRKISKGNFFFKKFFFKTLLRTRKLLKFFFFLKPKTRQKKITKSILKNQKNYLSKNSSYEYTILNTILRSHFCIFVTDLFSFLKNGFIFLNGVAFTNYNIILVEGDCLQLKLSKSIYRYIYSSKKFLKKKIALFRYSSWKFFKHKFFKLQDNLKPKKRKSPKYLHLLFIFKMNTPKFLEIDYLSLSIFFLKKPKLYTHSTYYLNKLFSFRLFALYNYKKIN